MGRQRKGNLRILAACECSGIVRDAFKARGHDAWSCDLLPSERPGNHIQGNVLDVLWGNWDMLIAFPDCTYLCVSGMHWTTRGLRDPRLTTKAIQFAETLWSANIPRICIENPIGVLSTRSKLGKPRQIIQPHQFGEDASKRTCLWLKGLPRLTPTELVKPRLVCKCGTTYDSHELSCPFCGASFSFSKPRWANQTDSGQNKLTPSNTRWMDRARTYPGIAKAMADQWGNL